MKNIKYLKVVLLNVFVLLFILSNYNCGVNDVDGKNINITGVVTDESGDPVDSARVTLYILGFLQSSTVAATWTNSNGMYSISKFKNNRVSMLVGATKTIKDSLGILQVYTSSITHQISWTDKPQVINIIIKHNRSLL